MTRANANQWFTAAKAANSIVPIARFVSPTIFATKTSGYRDFLGLPEDWRIDDPKPNPVAKKNLPNLKQLLVWLYGSKEDDIKPVIASQNPDVKNLAAVLSHPRARTLMMLRNNLAEAHNSIGVWQRFGTKWAIW